jgi:hypothetical protein
MEAVVALGFAVLALIVALYALGHIAALWLRKLGSGQGSWRPRQRKTPAAFAKTTVTGLSEAKEEVS